MSVAFSVLLGFCILREGALMNPKGWRKRHIEKKRTRFDEKKGCDSFHRQQRGAVRKEKKDTPVSNKVEITSLCGGVVVLERR